MRKRFLAGFSAELGDNVSLLDWPFNSRMARVMQSLDIGERLTPHHLGFGELCAKTTRRFALDTSMDDTA